MAEQSSRIEGGDHAEKIIVSVTNTLDEILTERGFFSVHEHSQYTNSLFSFLENEFADFLSADSLTKYLTQIQVESSESQSIVKKIRERILDAVSAKFVDGDDEFVNRFNAECRAILEVIKAHHWNK